MSRRMSLGVGRSTPLTDASSFHNSRHAVGLRSDTPSKDRHTQLQEWRHSHRSARTDDPTSKRARHDQGAPPLGRTAASTVLPPGANPSPLDGLSAVERVRMRRMMQNQGMMMQMQYQQQEDLNASGGNMNSSFDQYDAEDSTMSFRLTAATTPSFLPSSSSSRSSRRQSIAVFRNPARSQESEQTYSFPNGMQFSQSSQPSLSQLSADSISEAGNNNNNHASNMSIMDPVEGAGLRSSNRQLQLRVEQLEREKMELYMSKAPLEAQFRQKEEAWEREQTRLQEEIEQSTVARSRAENDKRDLALKNEAMEAEVRQLRLELRKASSQFTGTSSMNMITGAPSSANMGVYGNGMWKQMQQQSDTKEVSDLKEEVEALRLDNVSIEKEMHAIKIQLASTLRSYEDLVNEYNSVAQSSNINRDAEIQLEVLTVEHVATSAQLNAVCSELAATKARADATIEAMDKLHKDEIEQVNFEIAVLKTRAGKLDSSHDSSFVMGEEDDAVLRARIEERDRRIKDLEMEIRRGEEIRRQMHNRIQELRGNIRVFVRCRPFLPSDQQTADPAIQVSPDGESLLITDPRHATACDFKFDKVFPPSSGQDNVFDEVSDFVQSALDGYQVCLFSYGQTGSGKTHTMQGSGIGAMRGIIPRAVEQILTQANTMQNQKWEFTLAASFLEIYNENLKDLLHTMAPKTKGEAPKLAIKRNRAGKSFVENLTEVPIETVDSCKGMSQLETLMGVAARARSVASTKMNAESSRSHSVFMLHISGRNHESGTEVQGSLNLCDLAGSERLDRSGAGSDAKRLKETQSINKSLSCLGDVFNALAQRASHIPFRNSKLTYLLQDCLSGDGKALMFVNLSPTTESSNESLCSLRFAQRVNQVELGKPTKNIQYNAAN
ncbi:hypothetical protein MPSEU_000000400 [Mayamaea pseudoterrestris]|nr:hypothetical protein MPSEU_000000400 [Mayamaea pseudoterrestris]